MDRKELGTFCTTKSIQGGKWKIRFYDNTWCDDRSLWEDFPCINSIARSNKASLHTVGSAVVRSSVASLSFKMQMIGKLMIASPFLPGQSLLIFGRTMMTTQKLLTMKSFLSKSFDTHLLRGNEILDSIPWKHVWKMKVSWVIASFTRVLLWEEFVY